MNVEEIARHHENILIQLIDDLNLDSKIFSNLINDVLSFSFAIIRLKDDSEIDAELKEHFETIRSTLVTIYQDERNFYKNRNQFQDILIF